MQRAASIICMLALATIEGRAAAQAARFPRVAASSLHQATADAQRALGTGPEARPALAALGEVLERNTVPQRLLRAVIANPHAKPYLVDSLRALRHVDRVPGVLEVLARMARARDDAGQRGSSFELVASACVRDRLRSMGTTINGNEVDAMLYDGTIVEMIDRHRLIGKAQDLLRLRSQGRYPMMLMVPAIDEDRLARLREGALRDGLSLKVMVVDTASLTATEVLSVDGRGKRLSTALVEQPQSARFDPWRLRVSYLDARGRGR